MRTKVIHTMGLAVLLGACGFTPDGMDGDPGGDQASGYGDGFRIEMTVANPTGEALADIPILVRLGADMADPIDLDTIDPEHLSFESPGGEVLAHEIDTWDVDGVAWIWVTVRDLPAEGGAVRLYYRPAVDPSPAPAESVWKSGYEAVWHFSTITHGEQPTITDSARRDFGVVLGHDRRPSLADGPIGHGLAFHGMDDHVEIGTFEHPRQAFTYAVWFRPEVDLDRDQPRQDLFYGRSTHRPHLSFNRDSGGALGLYVKVDGADVDVTTTRTSWTADRWHFVAFTWDGIDVTTYVDGAPITTTPRTGVAAQSSGLVLGQSAFGENPFRGSLDELRVSSVARSPAWIELQHLSVRDELIEFGPIFRL